MEKLRHVIAQIPMQPAKESMDVPQELSIWALQVKQKMPWCEEQQPLEGSLEKRLHFPPSTQQRTSLFHLPHATQVEEEERGNMVTELWLAVTPTPPTREP